MKIFFDTEFIEDGKTIELISIGMVREDGQELYLENHNCDFGKASEWIKKNVMPHLGGIDCIRFKEEIGPEIIKFVGEKPEFWGYYADYDWVVLCQLYGTMMDLPKRWPMFCMDIKQLCVMKGDPELPKQEGTEHNALEDAKWNKQCYDWLTLLPEWPR